MTVLAVGLIGLALLSLPGALRSAARNIPPERWARLVVACMLGGAAVWETSLLLTGRPTVLRATHAAGLADACVDALGGLTPTGSPVAGWLAVALATATAVQGVRTLRRTRRAHAAARVEAWIGAHSDRGAYDLVVLPCAKSVAMSVAGASPQVVISDGLVARLTARQLELVLRHEASHLAHRHDRFLTTAAFVSEGLRYVPTARVAARVLVTALERWADEDAVETAADRTCVRDALLAIVGHEIADAVAAFARPATIRERLAALDAPSPSRAMRPTVVVATPAVALGLLAAAGLAVSNSQGLLLAIARICTG
ncbi:MAG TPA: M56 family metallopeptidase [Acidimicrobiales bacterium]|nr:M56 family metallopeptidase [Acidimicrobiales bacterium]